MSAAGRIMRLVVAVVSAAVLVSTMRRAGTVMLAGWLVALAMAILMPVLTVVALGKCGASGEK